MVDADEPTPWLSTVALSVKLPPGSTLLSLTDGVCTTRSGGVSLPPVSVTETLGEQLFCVSDSPETESTQAP